MILWFRLVVCVVVWKLLIITSLFSSGFLPVRIVFPQPRFSHSISDFWSDQLSLHTPPHCFPIQTLTFPQHPLIRSTLMLSVVATTKQKELMRKLFADLHQQIMSHAFLKPMHQSFGKNGPLHHLFSPDHSTSIRSWHKRYKVNSILGFNIFPHITWARHSGNGVFVVRWQCCILTFKQRCGGGWAAVRFIPNIFHHISTRDGGRGGGFPTVHLLTHCVCSLLVPSVPRPR